MSVGPLQRVEREPGRTGVAHRSVFWFAVLMLGLVLFSPPTGLGVIGCPFRGATGLPCPGCGITRSMTLATHGRFAESWRMHPFGGVILLLLVALVCWGLLPRALRGRLVATHPTGIVVVKLAALLLLIAMSAWWFARLMR